LSGAHVRDKDGVNAAMLICEMAAFYKKQGITLVDKMQSLYDRALAGDRPKKEELPPEGMGLVGRIARMEEKSTVQKIPVSLVAFGNIAILGYAGEPFTEYAEVLRKEVPQLFLLTACLANGAEGYLPSKAAFDEGSYEVAASNFPDEIAPVLQETAVGLLKEYLGK